MNADHQRLVFEEAADHPTCGFAFSLRHFAFRRLAQEGPGSLRISALSRLAYGATTHQVVSANHTSSELFIFKILSASIGVHPRRNEFLCASVVNKGMQNKYGPGQPPGPYCFGETSCGTPAGPSPHHCAVRVVPGFSCALARPGVRCTPGIRSGCRLPHTRPRVTSPRAALPAVQSRCRDFRSRNARVHLRTLRQFNPRGTAGNRWLSATLWLDAQDISRLHCWQFALALDAPQ
jgi:hypothetical protein